jgi:hypothetical protein
MKGTPRLGRLVTAISLPVASALTGCATAAHTPASAGASPVAQDVERGPRVRIWTTDELSSLSRVRPVIRLEDDAYVVVVNVGLDGYANVIFPESPDDDGFMRGGRTYRLPSFFPGFANHFYRSRYGRLYNATSAYDDIYDRYAGYVFVIASWRPMHFQVTEALGLWDDYRLAAHERQLEPYVVMHDYAQKFASGRGDYTARFARYAAFAGGFANRSSLASCLLYAPGFGYFPSWTLHTIGSWWFPLYGFAYRGTPRCGYGVSLAFNTARPVRGTVVTPPVSPTPTPGQPKPAPRPRTEPSEPDERDDDKDRNARPKTRRERVRQRAADEETVVDVNRETRAAQRRGEGPRRAVNRGRADYGWARESAAERYGGASGRATRRPADYDSDAHARASGSRTESSHGERARSEPRASEPRRDPSPRAEPARAAPRSEPRQEPRAQPAPAPRAEPAARSEPRGERQPKPAQR